MEKQNPIADKSKHFAIRIIKLYKHLSDSKKEYILSKQLLRSGTSIGANISEALCGISKKDFLQKCTLHLRNAQSLSIGLSYFMKLIIFLMMNSSLLLTIVWN